MATNNLSADDECSICLDPFRISAARGGIVQTPCQHIFHQKCLIGWITGGDPGGCCPLCKHEMRACDATPVRIENAKLANVKVAVIPLRRSRRLLDRQRPVLSIPPNRIETPATNNDAETPQNSHQPILRTLGEPSLENSSRSQPLATTNLESSVPPNSTLPAQPQNEHQPVIRILGESLLESLARTTLLATRNLERSVLLNTTFSQPRASPPATNPGQTANQMPDVTGNSTSIPESFSSSIPVISSEIAQTRLRINAGLHNYQWLNLRRTYNDRSTMRGGIITLFRNNRL